MSQNRGMPRDLSTSVSHNKNTVVWLSAVPRREGGWRGKASSAHSCSPRVQQRIWLRSQTTGEWQPSVCWEGKLYLLSSAMVWLRQAASELRRGLEPAGWRDVDWQPSPQTPTGDMGCGPAVVVPRGWCVFCFSQLAAPSLSSGLQTRPQSRLNSCIRPTWRS